jgi:regulator of protease activity HflC (stomatin/prohibitin superfamily)
MKRILPVLALFALAACDRVDQTEYCVKTQYGNVTAKGLEPGLVFTGAPGVSLTCFSLTDQNFPEVRDPEKDHGTLTLDVQTGGGEQPLTVQVEVSAVYAFDPSTVYNVFTAKRSEDAAEVEVFNSIQEGTRAAFTAWTVTELFGADRAALSDSVKSHIQRKLGNRAQIKNVFVKSIKLPGRIEAARVAAAEQAQVLDKARSQYVIDSTNAQGTIMKAEAEARANQLRAQSYSSNAKLLDLEIARVWSEGLGNACREAQTCIIGGQVMDLLPLRNRQ